MPSSIEILPNIPSQSFKITLEGKVLDMRVKWNSRMRFFTLDISEGANAYIKGLALKTGLNLLDPFNFGIGGLIVVDVTNTGLEMTLENVGTDVFLIHFTEAELEAAANG